MCKTLSSWSCYRNKCEWTYSVHTCTHMWFWGSVKHFMSFSPTDILHTTIFRKGSWRWLLKCMFHLCVLCCYVMCACDKISSVLLWAFATCLLWKLITLMIKVITAIMAAIILQPWWLRINVDNNKRHSTQWWKPIPGKENNLLSTVRAMDCSFTTSIDWPIWTVLGMLPKVPLTNSATSCTVNICRSSSKMAGKELSRAAWRERKVTKNECF